MSPMPSFSPRRAGTLGLLVIVALVATNCRLLHRGNPAPPTMSLQMSVGSASVTAGTVTSTVTGSAGVSVGDRVVVNPGGLAILHLSAGRTFQLEPGEALITSPQRLQLVSGNVLAQLSEPGEVDAPGLSVNSSAGAFRVDGGASPRVGVYSGSATMRVPGTSLLIGAYEQAIDTVGVLPRVPMPLQILATNDVWDNELLAPAISLDNSLASFGKGLDAQLGNASGLAFFRIVIPNAADVSDVIPYLGDSRSDVLIGWVIASDAATKNNEDLGQTFRAVMALWAAGETWGMLAMQLGVTADQVFAGLLNAVQEVGISVSSPVPHIPTTPPLVAAPTPQASPSTPPTQQPPPIAAPSPTPTLPAGLGGLINPVAALLNEVVRLLLPGLDPVAPPAPVATTGTATG